MEMANGAAGGIASTIAGALGALTPAQTLMLGGHLTSSNAAKAAQYLAAMASNPAGAGAFLALLGSVPNLPSQVVTLASQAVASLPNMQLFTQYITEAQVQVQTVLSSENAIQQAFGV